MRRSRADRQRRRVRRATLLAVRPTPSFSDYLMARTCLAFDVLPADLGLEFRMETADV